MKKELLEQLEQWFQDDEHQKIIKKISSLSENLDYELVGQLGRAYNNSDDYDKAIATLMSVAEQGAEDALWNFRVGYSYFYKNDYETALTFFQKCIDLGDEDENTIYLADYCKRVLEHGDDDMQIEELIIDTEIDYVKVLKMTEYISIIFYIEQDKPFEIGEELTKFHEEAYMNGYGWEAFFYHYLAKYYPVVLENMRTDPEAGMYVAYYEKTQSNEARAKKLAEIIIGLIENKEKLYSIVKSEGKDIDWD